jgi:dienelactone hydrolase
MVWPGAARAWLLCLAVAGGAATAQTPAPAPALTPATGANETPLPRWRPAEPRLALDLREEVHRISVTTRTSLDLQATGTLVLTLFRPPGDGPHPLAVVNHGRATAERRAEQTRQRYEPLARYLVSKGFAVLVPTRLGYGETFGTADPEAGGACNALRLQGMSLAASDQILAAVAHARTLAGVDVSRWVAIGQSVGGMATVALAWRRPPGLVAALNFAGGAGGRPDSHPGQPCSPERLEALWREQSRRGHVPMLWLYWANDLFWGEAWPQRWAAAWSAGGAPLEFHSLSAVGRDGHAGMSIDMDRWVPLAEAFLARAGFTRSGLLARPPASGFADIADADKLPAGTNAKALYTQRFLAAQSPRAFALGPGGASGWATGDWAMGRALGFCQSGQGQACKLYAVDDDVVWQP